MLPPPPRTGQEVSRCRLDRYLPLLEIGDADSKANVEGERHIPALEVVLAVEVGGLGDHPPPAVGAVNIPDVMPYRADQLGRCLLQVHDLFVGLVLDVGTDRFCLAPGCTHTGWNSR